jgi:hypothetical protein
MAPLTAVVLSSGVDRIVTYKWAIKVRTPYLKEFETKKSRKFLMWAWKLMMMNSCKFNDICVSDIIACTSYSSRLHFSVGNLISMKDIQVNIENKMKTVHHLVKVTNCGLLTKNVPDNQLALICIQVLNEVMCECNILVYFYHFLLYLLYHLPKELTKSCDDQNRCTSIAACFDIYYNSANQCVRYECCRKWVLRLDNNFILPVINLRAWIW